MPWPKQSQCDAGPSPRVRGSRARVLASRVAERSIPACAGEPSPRRKSADRSGVHPRVCGEPPCAPGRRRAPEVHPHVCGEPCSPASSAPSGWVHPRVCGGARSPRGRTAFPGGPSPRVRGSHCRARICPRRPRSIPACAGEPARRCSSQTLTAVHPRVCGGAHRAPRTAHSHRGPSPRVRGSRSIHLAPTHARRSIPACAGEPGARRALSDRYRVHPRVCGGALEARMRAVRITGPSPRVRGSPAFFARRCNARGSIPACAGEPPAWPVDCGDDGVHPRVCGGALRLILPSGRSLGPSPRVRGSLR